MCMYTCTMYAYLVPRLMKHCCAKALNSRQGTAHSKHWLKVVRNSFIVGLSMIISDSEDYWINLVLVFIIKVRRAFACLRHYHTYVVVEFLWADTVCNIHVSCISVHNGWLINACTNCVHYALFIDKGRRWKKSELGASLESIMESI
jgi:hypothetical protein